MSVTRRRRSIDDLGPILGVAAVLALIVITAAIWAAMAAGDAISHQPPPPRNIFTALIWLVSGKTRWPGAAATGVAAGELTAVVVLIVAGLRITGRREPWASVDTAVPHLAGRRDVAQHSVKAAAATAGRLGVQAPQPGVRLGPIVGTGEPAYANWEETEIQITGARRGKTTCHVIPAIIDAPGAVIATSNKRDVPDATRDIRAAAGQVLIFDPQGLAVEPPSWWWNPLTYITGPAGNATISDASVDKAMRLAAVLADYSRPHAARQDAFFEPEGDALLGLLLLAAAVVGQPVTTAHKWAVSHGDVQPALILRKAGLRRAAEAMEAVLSWPDKQRDGVYGTAKKSINFLIDDRIARWVTPDPDNPHRTEFSPTEFVKGTGTLYLLSKEGRGTAGALTTALTVATIEAAEERATRCPGGRLPVPLLAVLDEAANVCRWRDLPDLYSHYGSRGIHLMTLLQNWAQGAAVWGENAMTKMWSAANIRIYGGGEINTKFLRELSELIGNYYPKNTSTSVQRGRDLSRSVTNSADRPEQILDVADLAALPRGRAIVFGGGRPFLIQTEPWQKSPHADAVWASIRAHVPAGDKKELRNFQLQPAAAWVAASAQSTPDYGGKLAVLERELGSSPDDGPRREP